MSWDPEVEREGAVAIMVSRGLRTYRGAPMGAPNITPPEPGGPFSLRRVRLDTGGYDATGTYWGIGAPLYHAMSDDAELWLRAADREHAKATVRRTYPAAEFWR